MNLSDRLHCPHCQGRLSAVSPQDLRCSDCERTVPMVDGIVDCISDLLPLPPAADRYRGVTREDGLLAADLPARIKRAAGGRWPATLGEVIEFGCGLGTMTQSIAADEIIRGMLVLDSDPAMLHACKARLAARDPNTPVFFATLGGGRHAIRDTVADTVIGTALLSGIGDTHAFLTTVHQALKPGGRAMFVVPNQRFYQAACLSIAEALAQRHARDGAWPEGYQPAMGLLAETQRLLVHRGDLGFLGPLGEKHLFDTSALEDMAREIGFATAEAIPLDPDPDGAETISRLCTDAGASIDFAREFAPLAAAVGRPLLGLLNKRDQSAFSLLWLTKAPGPAVRIYTGQPVTPPLDYVTPDAAVGGVMPRWSVELLAHDTPDGIVVTIGGWCLCNIDTQWVRITLDDIAHNTPVWRHRPDVHEVLNRARIFHPLNAICSGLDGVLLFAGLHPGSDGCALRVDIVLPGGLVVVGPAQERLIMDQPVVVAH